MNGERVFLDANVLVYANDTAFPEKQSSARELLSRVIRTGTGCLSTQVMAEFWVTVTRKLKTPLSTEAARRQIALLDALTVVAIDRSIFLAALGIQERYQLCFWDSQIIATAQAASCVQLYSEDLQNGAVYGGVQVVNPFLP